MDRILWILAVIFFLLDAFNVAASIKWFSLAFACIALTFVL